MLQLRMLQLSDSGGVDPPWVRKIRKHLLTLKFNGSAVPLTLFGSDMRVQREGYGGLNLYEKCFLIIFDIYSIDR